ncbi:MAG: hypothetical protein ACI376_01250 [Candidatus Bruticola sp.]
MVATNRDALQIKLAEAASKAESYLKLIRKQLSALKSLEARPGRGLCRLELNFDSSVQSVNLEVLKQQVSAKLSAEISNFAAELSSEASALGFDCCKLDEARISGALSVIPGQPLPLLPIGLFRLSFNESQNGVSVLLGGVLAAEGWPPEAGTVASNLINLETELNSKRTAAKLALNRLYNAWAVLSKSEESCTLRELWPIVHCIGLAASDFGRRPSKNNLACYTKAQFMYDTIKALEEVCCQNLDSKIYIEESASELNIDSQIKIYVNGGMDGR